MQKKKVAILYTHMPHYRSPVMDELNKSKAYEFDLYFDDKGLRNDIKGSQKISSKSQIKNYFFGKFIFQFGISKIIFGKYDQIILLGNPYIISNWLILFLKTFAKTNVFLWTHGWLDKKRTLSLFIKNIFFKISDGLMLYGHKAKEIGLDFGFHKDFLHVIYNSLDSEKHLSFSQAKKANPSGHYSLLFISRLTKHTKLEIAYNKVLYL